MQFAEVRDQRQESLEYPQLRVYSSRDAFRHGGDDDRYGRRRNGAQRDESLERTERDADDLGVLRRAAHEDGT
jgi:hypothetical protein